MNSISSYITLVLLKTICLEGNYFLISEADIKRSRNKDLLGQWTSLRVSFAAEGCGWWGIAKMM